MDLENYSLEMSDKLRKKIYSVQKLNDDKIELYKNIIAAYEKRDGLLLSETINKVKFLVAEQKVFYEEFYELVSKLRDIMNKQVAILYTGHFWKNFFSRDYNFIGQFELGMISTIKEYVEVLKDQDKILSDIEGDKKLLQFFRFKMSLNELYIEELKLFKSWKNFADYSCPKYVTYLYKTIEKYPSLIANEKSPEKLTKLKKDTDALKFLLFCADLLQKININDTKLNKVYDLVEHIDEEFSGHGMSDEDSDSVIPVLLLLRIFS